MLLLNEVLLIKYILFKGRVHQKKFIWYPQAYMKITRSDLSPNSKFMANYGAWVYTCILFIWTFGDTIYQILLQSPLKAKMCYQIISHFKFGESVRLRNVLTSCEDIF